jgi:hypothetical protein
MSLDVAPRKLLASLQPSHLVSFSAGILQGPFLICRSHLFPDQGGLSAREHPNQATETVVEKQVKDSDLVQQSIKRDQQGYWKKSKRSASSDYTEIQHPHN